MENDLLALSRERCRALEQENHLLKRRIDEAAERLLALSSEDGCIRIGTVIATVRKYLKAA